MNIKIILDIINLRLELVSNLGIERDRCSFRLLTKPIYLITTLQTRQSAEKAEKEIIVVVSDSSQVWCSLIDSGHRYYYLNYMITRSEDAESVPGSIPL